MKLHSGHVRRKAILPSALLACLCLLPVAAHSASSYLQELEAEAARTEDDQATADSPAKETKQNWSPKEQTLSEKIAPGLSQEKFEERLKQSFYGSYLFYSALNDADQKSVYEDYKKDSSIDSIRESIKSHMKN